ncbi:uncharacterized protein LOC132744182 isoform X2 [Ruditapes philippinarum]|nr:uncharacterized protein LOC132744182 isoform X2 [Ruditapes philippinarum]XP_060588785.1 uncharacterized protein LOC132744182 isoform X2 [Ruditapes philippinarum]XP_060588786.1 uncharacterized protein LOC132744182 isoform X2 [Ruditapes philippinarum]
MISLSERFSRNKAVAVDSAESETDFSDDSLFPKRSFSTFSYSDTPPLSFIANFKNKITQNIEEEDTEESDDEVLDMPADWMEHFQKVLQNCRNLSGNHENQVSLSDNVPQTNNSLPLEYLKNSIDQYNKNLAVNDDLIVERNENEFDLFDENVNVAVKKDNKFVETQIDIDPENKIHYNDLGNAYSFKNDAVTEFSGPVTEKVTTLKSVHNVDESIPDAGEEVNNNCSEIDTSHVEKDDGQNALLDNNIDIKAKDELSISIAQKTASNTKQDILRDDNIGHRNDNVKYIDGMEKCLRIERETKDTVQQETQHSLIADVKETGGNDTVPKEISRNNQNIEIDNDNEIEFDLRKEANAQTPAVHADTCSEELSDMYDHENSKMLSASLEKVSPTILTEAKSHKKEKHITASSTEIDASPKCDQEKVQSKKSEPKIETKGIKVAQKINKDQLKSSLVSQSKKGPAKVKTLKIKPTFSFPLDELLPPVPTEKQKAVKVIKDETISNNREKHDFQFNETAEDIPSVESSFNPVAPIVFNEADVFHGTVYDNSPGDERLPDEYQVQHGNFEGHEGMAMAGFSGVQTGDEELDTGMANLIAALQSGDQQVVSVFQAALHDQIGLNLEALAAKARSGCQVASASESGESSLFGFYTERTNSSNTNNPDQTGDNQTNEKYDELFALLVEQCSALVKTEEDSSKLKSLLKLLQKESEMKLTKNIFLPEVEAQSSQPDVSHSDQESVQSEKSMSCQQETDLFEGRTLLKGGVEPRHIPKTTVRKHGQERPKDPRVNIFFENNKRQIKLPLPSFAVELYGEKKVKRILHLDWDAQCSNDGSLATLVNEKDPRMKRLSPVDSQIILIGEAAKSLVDTLQIAKETLSDQIVHDNKSQSSVKSQDTDAKNVETNQDKALNTAFVNIINKTETVATKAIPVLITPQKEADTSRCVKSVDRNSVLHCIDLQKSFLANEQKFDKRINVGVVKPLLEKQTSKENKPSVGIVKPIQLKTSMIKSETKSKEDRAPNAVTSKQSVKTQTGFDNTKGKIEENKTEQVKMLPLGRNPDIDPIVIDSDSEEGEIKKDDKGQVFESERSKTSQRHKSAIVKYDSKSEKDNQKNASQGRVRKVGNNNIVSANFSDISSYEDGEIDTLLDKSFHEKISVPKDSKDKKKPYRLYRKRERSSSRSSVESRVSHHSYSYNRQEERKHYNQTSSNRSISKEKSKESDRSRSRDRSRKRSHSKETNGSNQKHRHRHHTSKESTSYRDYSYRSETTKRHHSIDNEERRRHKTEGDNTAVESFKKIYKTKDFFKSEFSGKSHEKTRIPETVTIQNIGNEDSLSDGDIAKEYHEIFGKPKQQSFSSFDKDTKLCIETSFCKSEFEKPLQTDRLGTSHSKGINLSEKEFSYQLPIKTRRKSSEEIQKEVLEDKKFLENCKKKILGSSSKGAKEFDKNCMKQNESTVLKRQPALCGLSMSASTRSTELEEGEI